MRTRLTHMLVILSLMLGFAASFATNVAALTLSGATTTGVNSNDSYRRLSFASTVSVTDVAFTMSANTDYVALFYTTTNPAPTANTESAGWTLLDTRDRIQNGVSMPSATFSFPATTTVALLLLGRRNDNTPPGIPTAMTANGTVVSSGNNGTPAANCHNLGDGAVDQNGVSVDVWAAGLRKACGFMGYESGDNPMPAGTLLPAPRPFRFDYTYDPNEAVNGFKVFYHKGISGNGCGDVRQILHMGMSTARYDVRFHTMQIAAVQCTNNDRTTARIIDVAGQADSGCLLTKKMHTQNIFCSGNPMERLETAQVDCANGANGNTLDANHEYTNGGVCWPVWYATVHFDKPSGGSGEFEGSVIVRDPQNWLDAPTQNFDANGNVQHTNTLIPAGGEGSARGMNVAYADSFAGSATATWCAGFDASRATNTIVPCSTTGAWTQRVDSAVTMDVSGLTGDFIGGAGGTDQHPRTVLFGTGIVYAN